MDNRKYTRVHVFAKAVFYLKDDKQQNTEFSGSVDDISECGFKVSIDTKQNPAIMSCSLGKEPFEFFLIDEYDIFKNHKNPVIKGLASIARKEIEKDNLIIGCELIKPDQKLLDYISDQKTIDFIANLKNSNS